MPRQIFIVTAQIVDSNGSLNIITGYPKTFDSNSYSGDVDKARRRAEGEMCEAWGAMCKRDDRQIQTVTLETVDGFQLDKKSNGTFVEVEPAAQSE